MRVLVTGSEGLIGRSLCRLLLDDPLNQVDRYDYAIDPRMDITTHDIHDEIASSPPDLVIHLAAQSGVELARQNAFASWNLNVLATVNVLEAARYADIPVVAASSNHVYGLQDTYPTDENAPLNQLDTYSATKIAADVAVRSYWHNYGLSTAVIRNTNCYGPESPHLEHIIEASILKAMRGEDLKLRTDGLVKKGYLYVDDAAQAYITVGKALLNGQCSGQAFNVSAPSVSAIELAEKIYMLLGNTKNHVVPGLPFHDQTDEYLDSEKISEFGWSQKYTLDDGLALTIAAFKERYG